ncbi:NfeD family protein [Solimonas terrae]|uniref:Uncharacterized protein n=1 Tax=Solimonas terrae TaxID=1396819 RepID=A0A6M2BNP9_9GAMM|nr:NfeD family protein [Solimonas terrae]NGY03689.1 hypothetical protein [Solimonas terrae]
MRMCALLFALCAGLIAAAGRADVAPDADPAGPTVHGGIGLQAADAARGAPVGNVATGAIPAPAPNIVGARIVMLDPGWRDRLLGLIARPIVAYLLLLAGIYGLLLEALHPGATLPGVVGASCLLLWLFAVQVLPIDYRGLALMVLGLMLLFAEATVPSFGVLGVGGLVAFVTGSITLMGAGAGHGFDLALGLGLAIAVAMIMALTLYFVWRVRRAASGKGSAEFIGSTVQVQSVDGSCHEGWARFHGERWRIAATRALAPGDTVRIVDRDGLTLVVEPFASSGTT